MKDLSFDEFPASTFEQWETLVKKELGDRSADILDWNNENGFRIPSYHVSASPVEVSVPESWDIFQSVSEPDLQKLNGEILTSLTGGTSAIGIRRDLHSYDELNVVLKDVRIDFIATHFISVKKPLELCQWLISFCREKNIDTKKLRGSIQSEFTGDHEMPGHWKEIATLSKQYFSVFRTVNVYADRIHNSGGNAVQELAYALACANEFMHQLTQAGFTVDEASAMIQVKFAVGSSYFVEMAKLRAFRMLWKTLVEQYHPAHECTTRCFIHAETSSYLKITNDIHNNLLRTTTQTMSAILGGADSVEALPYDASTGHSETSLRLARNIQHLLTEESYFSEMKNAATGSYYIEAIVSQLIDAAWKSFLEIEYAGGIFKSGKNIDDSVRASHVKKQADIAAKNSVIVGVNKYMDKTI